ncbi:LacI family transcriptional regulator [Oscillospiraceae bacterium HV4-5-C5C]|nr:LacI family transcriptional regulator [Oscillospiraceae bacterium HV4-5-C5C]
MTIKDIAEKAGCAISTVSRALNDHPDVSEETKQKIRAIVDECGFIPNSNARQLKALQRKSICILVKGSANLFFEGIIERMQAQITLEGYAAEVHYLDEAENEVRFAQRLVREQKPAGLIFMGGNRAYFEENFSAIHTPAVLVSSLFPDFHYDNLSQVGVDDCAAGAEVCHYLLDRGHRELSLIGGALDASYVSQRRFSGFQDAYQKATGQALAADCYQTASFNAASGYQAMLNLLKARPDITAVFCLSDLIALGAMRAAHEKHRRIPEDLSVIGFDGIPLTHYFIPRLVSLRQPQREMAGHSVSLLLRQIEHADKGAQLILPTDMTQGESVRSR